MSDLQKRIAAALFQAALEGDESPKMLLSQRVVEILLGYGAEVPQTGGLDLTGVDLSKPENLRMALEESRVSQVRLADRLGIHTSAVSKVLAGKRRLSAHEAEEARRLMSGVGR